MLGRVALASIGVSGAVAMVYQVAWTRALSLVIGSSTYAFSLILVCFLIGLAGGAAIYARRHAKQPDQPGNLSVIHLLVAATAFCGLLIMDYLPIVLLAFLQSVGLSPAVVFIIKFLVAGVIILFPTIFMGMVFPAVIRICSDCGSSGAAGTTGAVYAINTLGAIVGSFSGGFLLIPLVGLQPTLLLMVVVGLLLAGLFGVLSLRRRSRLMLPLGAVAVATVVLWLARPWNLEVMTAGVFRISRYEDLIAQGVKGATGAVGKGGDSREEQMLRWRKRARRLVTPERVVDTMLEPAAAYGVIFHREGVTTTVSLTRTVDHSLSDRVCWVRHSLLVNGKPDASLTVLHPRPESGCKGLLRRRLAGPGLGISPSGDAETQILSGLLPVCLHPGLEAPGSVMVIGWGSGITVGAVLQAPVRRVVAVELEREVLEAARHFEPHNHRPQLDRRLQLVNEDGRNFLSSNPQSYDVIISEPSNPWIAGCGNLFTKEFFHLVRERLNPGGIFLRGFRPTRSLPKMSGRSWARSLTPFPRSTSSSRSAPARIC